MTYANGVSNVVNNMTPWQMKITTVAIAATVGAVAYYAPPTPMGPVEKMIRNALNPYVNRVKNVVNNMTPLQKKIATLAIAVIIGAAFYYIPTIPMSPVEKMITTVLCVADSCRRSAARRRVNDLCQQH